jgi:dihydroflavonol-4-reductase
MRALVLGASGFIGLRVVDELLACQVHVRVTRRKSTPTVLFGRRALDVVWASLEDQSSLEAAMKGCDVAIVAAGYYPRYSTDLDASLQIATQGIRNVCDAAIQTRTRMVYTSSVAALGAKHADSFADEDDVAPPDPAEGVYPTVKKAMELEVDRARDRGLDAVSLLLGGCIGPKDYRLGTNGLLAALMRGLLPFRVDGWINVLSVDDAAAAHVAAIASTSPRYCIAGHNVRIDALLEQVAARYDVPFDVPKVSIEEARAHATAAEKEAEGRRERVPFPRELVDLVAMGKPVSSALAERELALRWTDLDEAIDAARRWMTRLGVAKPRIHQERREHAR